MMPRWAFLAFGLIGLAACGEEQAAPDAAAQSVQGRVQASSAACSLNERQQWARQRIEEWYLYPHLLDRDADPSAHDDLQSYVDALVAPAREAGFDRRFTFATNIADENGFFLRSQTVGYGFSLALTASGGLFMRDVYEGSPADDAGLARGDQILAIGDDRLRLRSVLDLEAQGGDAALAAALGDSQAGTRRWLRIAKAASGYTDIALIALEQRAFILQPLSPEFGVQILPGNIGYLNLRTFTDPAAAPMQDAFDRFRAAGVERLIIDLRYNRGGLVRIADYMGDLMGKGRGGQIFSYSIYRPEKASRGGTQFFQPQPQSIAPIKLAFITTADTASASEIIMNAMHPYVGQSAMIGLNTLGKPVGQVAIDNPACGDRLRIVAFKTENVLRQGDYHQGLSGLMPHHCPVGDDFQGAMGSAGERMTSMAIDWIEGRPLQCLAGGAAMRPLEAQFPSASQRHLAGSF